MNIVTELKGKLDDLTLYNHYLQKAEKAYSEGEFEESRMAVRVSMDIAYTHDDNRSAVIIQQYLAKMKAIH